MNLIQSIDALLPQTQCGKCGHPGCKPYAQGIAQGEAINKCPPGGEETITALASLLQLPVISLDPGRGTAPAQIAYIREAECIGCTKCIQACPVDAIVGAAKFMHTVIADECTGCDLCVAPCPVDCIDLIAVMPDNVVPMVGGLAVTAQERSSREQKRNRARHRFEFRNARLSNEEQSRQAERLTRTQKLSATPVAARLPLKPTSTAVVEDESLRKARIALTMSRTQLNKSLKAFGHPPIAEQAARLVELQQEYEAAEKALAILQADAPQKEVQPSVTKVDTSSLKRAKIGLAMARAALKKAETAAAPIKQLETLNAQLKLAEQALNDAEQATPVSLNPHAIVFKETLGS